jgi:hypothetical protein
MTPNATQIIQGFSGRRALSTVLLVLRFIKFNCASQRLICQSYLRWVNLQSLAHGDNILFAGLLSGPTSGPWIIRSWSYNNRVPRSTSELDSRPDPNGINRCLVSRRKSFA